MCLDKAGCYQWPLKIKMVFSPQLRIYRRVTESLHGTEICLDSSHIPHYSLIFCLLCHAICHAILIWLQCYMTLWHIFTQLYRWNNPVWSNCHYVMRQKFPFFSIIVIRWWHIAKTVDLKDTFSFLPYVQPLNKYHDMELLALVISRRMI